MIQFEPLTCVITICAIGRLKAKASPRRMEQMAPTRPWYSDFWTEERKTMEMVKVRFMPIVAQSMEGKTVDHCGGWLV